MAIVITVFVCLQKLQQGFQWGMNLSTCCQCVGRIKRARGQKAIRGMVHRLNESARAVLDALAQRIDLILRFVQIFLGICRLCIDF